MDMSVYKISNIKGFRHSHVITDNFSKYTWCLPLEKKNDQALTYDFSNSLNTIKRQIFKIERDRGTELYDSTLQKILKFNFHIFTHGLLIENLL